MTQDKINKAKALAEARPDAKSSRIILALCMELEKLRRLTLRRGTHPVGVLEPWPYGEHRGKPIVEVPEDYLLAWVAERRREVLLHDWGLGVIARRDLALYELITRHLETNGQPPIKTETGSETLPQT